MWKCASKPIFSGSFSLQVAVKNFFGLENVYCRYVKVSFNITLYTRKRIMIVRHVPLKIQAKEKNRGPKKNLPQAPLYLGANYGSNIFNKIYRFLLNFSASFYATLKVFQWRNNILNANQKHVQHSQKSLSMFVKIDFWRFFIHKIPAPPPECTSLHALPL